jgi:hypothetical protein
MKNSQTTHRVQIEPGDFSREIICPDPQPSGSQLPDSQFGAGGDRVTRRLYASRLFLAYLFLRSFRNNRIAGKLYPKSKRS